jgi:hypothetical protein
VPPVTADTKPPPPAARGRADELRRAARIHTGLPQRQRRTLLGESATGAHADDEALPGEDLVQPPIESNNFDAPRPERSPVIPQVTAHEAAHEAHHGDEHAPEHAPPHTAYAHVEDDEEAWWTGAD